MHHQNIAGVPILSAAIDIPELVWSVAMHPQPFGAVGSPIVPVLAVPPVPKLISKMAVPLLAAMLGLVPKPEEIVGAKNEKRTQAITSFHDPVSNFSP
jgi:hypothetical protein